MKRCKHCRAVKPLNSFYRDSASRDGHRPECKACTSARRKAWYDANRETEIARVLKWQRENAEQYLAAQRGYREAGKRDYRQEHLRNAFGITHEDYEVMLAAQGGGCAICEGKPKKISLHIDHDHESGEIRGLLCFRCNGGLGQFKEDAELLLRAVEYLDGGAHSLIEATELADHARGRALALRG